MNYQQYSDNTQQYLICFYEILNQMIADMTNASLSCSLSSADRISASVSLLFILSVLFFRRNIFQDIFYFAVEYITDSCKNVRVETRNRIVLSCVRCNLALRRYVTVFKASLLFF